MEKLKDWHLILSPRTSAHSNMKIDASLFQDFEKGLIPPTFRIYSWKRPSITIGYSQKQEQELDLILCRKEGIDIARRPTGGGIVFHSLNEITYSFVAPIKGGPRVKDWLKKSSNALISALKSFNITASVSGHIKKWDARYCFSYPSSSEIVVGGRKIVGLAQKAGKRGVLQQGAICVDDQVDSMLKHSKAPVDKQEFLSKVVSVKELAKKTPSFEDFSKVLISSFEHALGVNLNKSF